VTYVQLTTDQIVAMNGAALGVKMKTNNGSWTVASAVAKVRLHGSRLSTMAVRFAALIKFQYITEKAYKKNNLKSKYE
jgi:hypothetical protein